MATLFDGMVGFAPRCQPCGLVFSDFNVGDGPAALLTLVLGGLILGLAITLELTVGPPLWVHAVLWAPLTLVLVVGALRVSKAALLFSEYRHQAGEGRIDKR